MGRSIALLFHDRGTRKGWVVSSTPRPHFTHRKDPVPILQDAELASGPVWTSGKSSPHPDSIADSPNRSQSLYQLSYLAHPHTHTHTHIYIYIYIWGTRWRSWLRLGDKRSQVRPPMVSMEFVIDIFLPAALWHWSWLTPNRNEYQGFPGE